MPGDVLRCSRCRIPLDPGADRCPSCLRKSTLVGGPPAPPAEPVALRFAEAQAPPERPTYAGVRAAVLLAAYAVYAPLVALILGNEAALKARLLWLPACFAAMLLGTLPLRMAFAPPEASSSARDAAREYAIRMAMVLGFAAGMSVAQAVAAQIVGETVPALFLGLLFFLAPLFVAMPVAGLLRKKLTLRQALGGAAKQAGLALLVVGMVAGLAFRPRRAAPKPITLPPRDVKALLDPLDLESVRVKATWEADESGAPALHLRADAPELERTLQKLVVEAVVRTGEVSQRRGASGAVTVVVPSRFENAENERKVREEERTLNEALSSAERATADGRPIQVRFVFGR